MISCDPGFSLVTNLECNCAFTSLRSQAVEPASSAFVAGLFDTKLQTVREEAESVEQGTLAHPILANYRSHWSQRGDVWCIPKTTEGYILQDSVILDPDSLDYRHRIIGFLACSLFDRSRDCHYVVFSIPLAVSCPP